MLKKAREFKERYQKWIMPGALILGFVVDTITLNQIDQKLDNAILLIHLLIVATCISLLTTKKTVFGDKIGIDKKERFITTLMLFSFGGLFSGFLIFYTRSGSLISSWPFVVALLALMLGTEMKRHYYSKIVFQITILFIALLAHMAFLLPLIFNRIGVSIFIISSLVAFFLAYIFMRFLRVLNRKKLSFYWRGIITRLLVVFVIFHALYFTNIIPPIPLSLKYKAVYYEVEKTSNFTYTAYYEKTPWWNIVRKRSRDVQWQRGDDIFVFTQIFAPAKLNTEIYHVWEYRKNENHKWKETDRIRIPISGGRKDGFRGFSNKTNLTGGEWRVKISTGRNQMLGNIKFTITESDTTPELEKEVL